MRPGAGGCHSMRIWVDCASISGDIDRSINRLHTEASCCAIVRVTEVFGGGSGDPIEALRSSASERTSSLRHMHNHEVPASSNPTTTIPHFTLYNSLISPAGNCSSLDSLHSCPRYECA